jgi:hypothetical protein
MLRNFRQLQQHTASALLYLGGAAMDTRTKGARDEHRTLAWLEYASLSRAPSDNNSKAENPRVESSGAISRGVHSLKRGMHSLKQRARPSGTGRDVAGVRIGRRILIPLKSFEAFISGLRPTA